MLGVLETSVGPIAILSGHLRLPLRGVRIAYLELDLDVGIDVPVGPVDVVLAGEEGFTTATFRGTILEGDAVSDEGRARCIVRGGAGRLHSQTLAQRDYHKSPFDVSVGLIIQDAILDSGESPALNTEENLASLRVPRWHRAGGCTGKEVLDRLAERFGLTWRFDDDGMVHVRLNEDYPLLDTRVADELVKTGIDDGYSKIIEVAPPAALIRPGQTVLDRRIDEVVYRLDATRLRAELYYGIGAGGSASDIAATVRASIPSLLYRESHDAIVRRQHLDGTLDVEAINPRVGAISNVPYSPGLVGCRMVFVDGDRLQVAWQDGDESRPIAFAPEMLRQPNPTDITPWGVGVSRVGDAVEGGTLTLAAVAHPSGAIASIVVTYVPAVGAPTIGTLTPATPVSFTMNGRIQTGSEEVFIRGEGV